MTILQTQTTDSLAIWRNNLNILSTEIGDITTYVPDQTTSASDVVGYINDIYAKKVNRSGDTIASLIVSGLLTGATASFSGQITSTLSTGAPLVVASNTVVANLNASFLEGGTWESPLAIGVTAANSGAFTTISATQQITSTLSAVAPFVVASNIVVANLNSSLLLGATWVSPLAIGTTTPNSGAFTTLSSTGQITSTYSAGTPFIIASNIVVANLNASLLLGATWAQPLSIGSTTANTGRFTTLAASQQFTSTVSNGTAPFIVASNTNVANLNASLLMGSTWSIPQGIGSSTANTGAFTSLSATGQFTSSITGSAPLIVASNIVVTNLNSSLLLGASWSAPLAIGSTTTNSGAFTTISASGQITSLVGSGAPFVVASTTQVPNLNVQFAQTLLGSITGGSAGNIVWQSAANTTGFVSSGTAGQVLSSTGATSPSWVNQSSLIITATNLSGLIPLANGGANASLTASNGGIVYSTATALSVLAGNSSANIPLVSGAGSAPTWGSYAIPSAIGVSGSLLQSNGTNTVFTTATYPTSTTANAILYSTATNTVGQLAHGLGNQILGSGTAGIPMYYTLANTSSIQVDTTTTPGTIYFNASGTLSATSIVGNLTVGPASITYIGGNISTTGTLASGAATLNSLTVINASTFGGDVTIGAASIKYSTGNILTTGTLGAGATTLGALTTTGSTSHTGAFAVTGATTLTGSLNVSTTATATAFTDGYNTFTLAQINRAGSMVEVQYGATTGSLVRIGGNGSHVTTFDANTGNATIGGTITVTGASTLNGTTIPASSTLLTASNYATYAIALAAITTTTIGASGAVSGYSFIPTSATVPTNGVYLSAANTLAWATNSVSRMSLSSIGTLTATAFSGPLTGNVTGNLTGNVTGNVTGTASNATLSAQITIATSRTDAAWYQAMWSPAGATNAYSTAAVQILSSGYGGIGFGGTNTAPSGTITGSATSALIANGTFTASGLYDGLNRAYSASYIPQLNQNTSGNAATATNVAYSGLTGTIPTWNQNTTGNAANITAYIINQNLGTTNSPTFSAVTATSFSGALSGNATSATSVSSITSSQVTTGLGFTPYNATNPSAYISSITSSNVTTALGFTPYNATNPSAYITSSATSIGNITTNAPNYGSYGSIGIAGSVGGYSGISFSANTATIMISSSISGVYRNNTTWDWSFTNGVLTAGTIPSANISGTVASATTAVTCTGNAATATSVPYTGLTGTIPNISIFPNNSGYITSVQSINFTKLRTNGQTPAFTKTIGTGVQTLTTSCGISVVVNNILVNLSAGTTVTLPTLTAGTDYAIYVCTDGTIRADSSFTNPTGYTTSTSFLIGGFHYSLTTSGSTVSSGSFATTGNGKIWIQADVDAIAGINTFSIWDLKFRPKCDPRGMVLVGNKVWFDIYLCNNNTAINGTSKAGTYIASGTVLPIIPSAFNGNGTITYPTMNWWVANELVRANWKRLPWEHEFVDAAFGVTENQSIDAVGFTYPLTLRNAGYTSKYGIEQSSGHQWIWGQDTGQYYDNSSWSWKDVNGNTSATGSGRGQIYTEGTYGICRVLLGGARTNAANSGSRTSAWNGNPWFSYWSFGARAVCDHMFSV